MKKELESKTSITEAAESVKEFGKALKGMDKGKKIIDKANKEAAESIAVCKSVKKEGKHFYKTRSNGFTSCDCGRAIAYNEKLAKEYQKKLKTLQKAQEKSTKKETSEKPEGSESWVQSLDLKQLCRIKGKKGLYMPVTEANKAGMLLFEEFLNPGNRIWSNADKIDFLDEYKFFLDKGETIGLIQVFENIEKNIEKIEGLGLNSHVMKLIVPGYDPEKFKDYHAGKVLSWFQYLKEKMVAYVEEGEKEMAAEEVTEEAK